MTLCYLGLGSNLNSPERQLRKAIAALRTLPYTQVYKIASFYSNTAWGRKTQPQFCNTVIAINTRLNPFQLLRLCQKIEYQQGRVRNLRWGSRTIDIDILLFGDQKINGLNLKIPHPRILEREFVLKPLLEIAPKLSLNYNESKSAFLLFQ